MDRRSRALDKEVAWVVAHPARARAWSDSGKITAVAMVATLALGLVIHLAGFTIGSGSVPMPIWLPRDLTATLVSNLGIVLWTSVVLVVFLDTLPSRVQRRAGESMALAARTLDDRGLPVPSELADLPMGPNPIGPRQTDRTLQAVLERLEAIERLLAEQS
jgi:hypothetical protein